MSKPKKLKTYRVACTETQTVVFRVEATSKEDAIEAVLEGAGEIVDMRSHGDADDFRVLEEMN